MSTSKLELNVILNAVDKLTRPFKDAQKVTGNLAGKIKQTRHELKNLNIQAEKINGFKKTKAELLAVSHQLEQAKTKANTLARQFKDQQATKVQSKQLRAAIQNARKLTENHDKLRLSLQQQRDELTRSGMSTHQLANHQKTLKSNIAATTAQIQQQQQELTRLGERQHHLNTARQNFQQNMQQRAMIAGNGYAALATGRHLAQTGVLGLSVGYEFDALMSKTQSITRIEDKNSPQMQALRQQARTLPLSSKFTDSEVAAGQFYLARTGYNAKQVLDAMPAMLNLATASDLDLGKTADIASNIQTAMGIPANKMDHVADVLTALSTRNNVNIQMLGESLKYSAGVGHAFGQSLETVAASTAILGNSGIQGSQAGTSMRSILTRIGTSATVRRLGVKTKDKNGNMRDLVDILKDINIKTAKMGNLERGAILGRIAGKEASSGFLALMDAVNSGLLTQMRGKPGEYKGEAAKVAKTIMDNLKGDMTILHAGLENISVELFEKNNQWLRKTAQCFSHILHSVGEFLKKNPKVSQGLVMVGAALAAITTIIGGLMIAIVGLLAPFASLKLTLSLLGIKGFSAMGLIAKGFKVVGTALLFIGRAAMANPVIAIIAILATAAYLIYKNWDSLGPKLAKLWETIKTKATEKWHAIVQVITSLKDRFLDAGRNLIKWITDGISEKFEYLKAKLLSITDYLPDNIKSVLGIESKVTSEQDMSEMDLSPMFKLPIAALNGVKLLPSNITDNIKHAWDSVSALPGLQNYSPVSTQTKTNTYNDNSQTEITIKVDKQESDILAIFKRAFEEYQRANSARQRSLLGDTQ